MLKTRKRVSEDGAAVREGLTNVTFEQRPGGVRTNQVGIRDRELQKEGLAQEKALKRECVGGGPRAGAG